MNPSQTQSQTEIQTGATPANDLVIHTLFGDTDGRADLDSLATEFGDESAPSGYHPIFYTLLLRC